MLHIYIYTYINIYIYTYTRFALYAYMRHISLCIHTCETFHFIFIHIPLYIHKYIYTYPTLFSSHFIFIYIIPYIVRICCYEWHVFHLWQIVVTLLICACIVHALMTNLCIIFQFICVTGTTLTHIRDMHDLYVWC